MFPRLGRDTSRRQSHTSPKILENRKLLRDRLALTPVILLISVKVYSFTFQAWFAKLERTFSRDSCIRFVLPFQGLELHSNEGKSKTEFNVSTKTAQGCSVGTTSPCQTFRHPRLSLYMLASTCLWNVCDIDTVSTPESVLNRMHVYQRNNDRQDTMFYA